MAKKLFYKIGEACKLLDIQPYVLRYWETEFPFLNPGKSKSGQRVYSEREVEVIRRIKGLLYDEGYTIAGAKKKLEAEIGDLLDENETGVRGPQPSLFAPVAESIKKPARALEAQSAPSVEPPHVAELEVAALDSVEALALEPEPADSAGVLASTDLDLELIAFDVAAAAEPVEQAAVELDSVARQEVETLRAGRNTRIDRWFCVA